MKSAKTKRAPIAPSNCSLRKRSGGWSRVLRPRFVSGVAPSANSFMCNRQPPASLLDDAELGLAARVASPKVRRPRSPAGRFLYSI